MFELDNFDLILWPWPLASVIFIFHLKVSVVVNSCCCLLRILYFYSSYKIDFKFWKSLRTDGYVERVLVNDLRWINSFTVFTCTIHKTTKDLYKSKLENQKVISTCRLASNAASGEVTLEQAYRLWTGPRVALGFIIRVVDDPWSNQR